MATPFIPFTGRSDCDFDCNDLGSDGFFDLTLKFDAQAVVAALGEVNDGDCIVLKLEGALTNGTPIIGEDVVRILEKK